MPRRMRQLLWIAMFTVVGLALVLTLPGFVAWPLYGLFAVCAMLCAIVVALRRSFWQNFRVPWRHLEDAGEVDADLIALAFRHDSEFAALRFAPVGAYVARETSSGQIVIVRSYLHASRRQVALVAVVRNVVPVPGREFPIVITAEVTDVLARRADGVRLAISNGDAGANSPRVPDYQLAIILKANPATLAAAMDAWSRQGPAHVEIAESAGIDAHAEFMARSERLRLDAGWLYLTPDNICRLTLKGAVVQLFYAYPPGRWIAAREALRRGRRLLHAAHAAPAPR